MADGLLGVFRHQAFHFTLGLFMLEEADRVDRNYADELGSGIGRADVDDSHRLDARPRRLNAEQARGLGIFRVHDDMASRPF